MLCSDELCKGCRVATSFVKSVVWQRGFVIECRVATGLCNRVSCGNEFCNRVHVATDFVIGCRVVTSFVNNVV